MSFWAAVAMFPGLDAWLQLAFAGYLFATGQRGYTPAGCLRIVPPQD